MIKKTAALVLLLLLPSCGQYTSTICDSGKKIKQINIYATTLNSDVRINPTVDDLIQHAHYQDTIVDESYLLLICTKLARLKIADYQPENFQLRAVCEIRYSDNQTKIVEIDTYGQMKSENVILEDSYSLLALLGVACLSSR